MIRGLHHAAIICSDYQLAKDFYSHILGLNIVNETYRAERDSYKCDLVLPDGVQIELFSFPNPPHRVSQPEACGLRHLALLVTDVRLTVNWLAEKGVMAEAIRVDELTGKQYTFIRDPDDLPIELYQL